MIYLALGRPADRSVFSGTGSQPPFGSACYPRQGGRGDLIEDPLDLALEGSPAALQEGISALERWLEAARSFTMGQAGQPVCLYLQEDGGGPSVFSPVSGGWVERLKGQASGRSILVRLHLLRANYWEDVLPIWLPLSNLHGTSQVAIQVDAVNGSQRCNYADLAADAAGGDLPAPLLVRLKNTSLGSPLGRLDVHLQQAADPAVGAFSGWLEAENASGGTLVEDSTASGGALRQFGWSGKEEQALCAWQLSAGVLFQAGGRHYQPVLRCHPAPEEEIQVRINLADGETSLWSGPPAWLETGRQLQALPALQIPAGGLALDPLKPLALQLHASASGIGEHTLGLDALHLAGVDGWRRLLPVGAGLAYGSTLVDDTRRGIIYQSAPAFLADYTAAGTPLLLTPGALTRLAFFQSGMDGSAGTGRTLEVSVSAARRFRRI